MAPAINTFPTTGMLAPLATTYAGDRLLTSARAADGDGHAESGRKGRRDRRRAADRSQRHTGVRADEARRYL